MLSVRVNWVDLTCQPSQPARPQPHTGCDRLNSIFSKYFHNNSLAVAHSTHKTLATRAPHCVRAHHMERRNSKIFAEIKKNKNHQKIFPLHQSLDFCCEQSLLDFPSIWHVFLILQSETKFSVFSFSQQLSLLNLRQFKRERGIVVW